jgi:hypothetical protein
VLDETRGCNVMITADDSFTNIKVLTSFPEYSRKYTGKPTRVSMPQLFLFGVNVGKYITYSC